MSVLACGILLQKIQKATKAGFITFHFKTFQITKNISQASTGLFKLLQQWVMVIYLPKTAPNN